MTKCQKDPTCSIFFKRGLFKGFGVWTHHDSFLDIRGSGFLDIRGSGFGLIMTHLWTFGVRGYGRDLGFIFGRSGSDGRSGFGRSGFNPECPKTPNVQKTSNVQK